MGFRFRHGVKLFPGVRLNASKSGLSMSIGTRGAWYTVGPKGRRRVTVWRSWYRYQLQPNIERAPAPRAPVRARLLAAADA